METGIPTLHLVHGPDIMDIQKTFMGRERSCSSSRAFASYVWGSGLAPCCHPALSFVPGTTFASLTVVLPSLSLASPSAFPLPPGLLGDFVLFQSMKGAEFIYIFIWPSNMPSVTYIVVRTLCCLEHGKEINLWPLGAYSSETRSRKSVKMEVRVDKACL